MNDDIEFATFVRRIRLGDDAAAAELVRCYEPIVRRAVRMRLRDPRLRTKFDSMDISQSVLGSFFARAAQGDYELDHPQQLVALLATMARNRLVVETRRHRRQRRDDRRVLNLGLRDIAQIAEDGSTPSREVADHELYGRVRASLNELERAIADLRIEGLSWADVAARLGGEPQARRMQLVRAFERVAQELSTG
ncbi:MAG: sigma-70 family RNA polymerase sigma factor [Planctomycetia bacterium]|nr:sigma-70 family RNA polymerase sigma factor [Planctomycetia bacterium]